MNNAGWIKIHRQLLDDPISSKPVWVWFWVFLLLKVNHQDKKLIWNGKEIVVKRGQLLTGRKTLCRESGVSEQTIRSILSYLKLTSKITIKTTNKWSLITVNKYEDYQEVTSKITIKQPTNNQQITTNKNDKNEKNINTDIRAYVSLFNEKFQTSYMVTVGRVKKLRLRLENYSMDQILKAVENLAASKFHQGDNDRGWKADPDFLLRSDEQIDKWIQHKEKKKGLLDGYQLQNKTI